MAKFIHLFSGGVDSTTLLYELLATGYKVECLTFDYHQTHRREINASREICKLVDVPHHVMSLPLIFETSVLGGGKPVLDGSSDSSIVPNRNMVFISIASAYALGHGGTAVSWAANKDDGETFPDCRLNEFLRPLNQALRNCHTRRMEVHAPYLMGGITKREIIGRARRLKVPLELTWSCYRGGKEPCGTCGACELRGSALASDQSGEELGRS